MSAAVMMQRRASTFQTIGMGEKTQTMGMQKEHDKELGKERSTWGQVVHRRGPKHLENLHNGEDGDADKEEEQTIYKTNVDIGDVIAFAKLAQYDRGIRRRNVVNLLLSIVCLVLFMLEIWLAYDRKVCYRDFLDPVTKEYLGKSDPTVKDYCIVQSQKTFLLKAGISIITFIQIILLCEYYRFQVKAERNAYWYLTDSILWRKHILVFLIIEIIVLLPHPLPVPGNKIIYDDKYGTFMFLRLYHTIRVLRDHSPIYTKRKHLLADSYLKKSGAVEFNWLLCVKFLFLQHTWMFVIVGVIVTWFTMAYVIWVFEREHQPLFTLQISFWMTCITMTTVGYGDITPTSNDAKVATGVTAVAGIILAALLVFAVMDALTLSPQDTRVRNLWTKKLTYDQQKVAAANYIRMWFEQYKAKKKVPDVKSKEYKKLMLSFNSKNAYLKGVLLTCRRDLSMAMELDDLVINRLEEKMGDMTGNIADRLAFRLGLRPSQYHTSHSKRRLLCSTFELKERVDKMTDEQKKILAKIDQILKVLIASNGSILGKIFN